MLLFCVLYPSWLALLPGDLGSLAGDGVLHGLQLLEQLLSAAQRVAGLPRGRTGTGA